MISWTDFYNAFMGMADNFITFLKSVKPFSDSDMSLAYILLFCFIINRLWQFLPFNDSVDEYSDIQQDAMDFFDDIER